jgi:hypothetical protein
LLPKDVAIIAEAREMFTRGEPWWPRPLILTLDAHRPGLSFEWVERCVHLLLPLAETDARASLLTDLDELRNCRRREAQPQELLEKGLAVWYKPPGRDAARTAVAKLYEAAAIEPDPRLPRYAIPMAAPINNFLWAASNSEQQLDLVIEEFVRLAEEQGITIT